MKEVKQTVREGLSPEEFRLINSVIDKELARLRRGPVYDELFNASITLAVLYYDSLW